jgi:hypothetical protein
MGDFWKGWQRRSGIVLLVITLAFMVGWVRSTMLADFIGLPARSTTHFIVSHGGNLELQRAVPDDVGGPPPENVTSQIDQTTPITCVTPAFAKIPPVIWGGMRRQWYYEGSGLRVGGVDVDWVNYPVDSRSSLGPLQFISCHFGNRRASKFVIPYWLIVLPGTLLSGGLIVRKPRRSLSETAPPG